MKLTEIELDNFKCFEHANLECAKFTLLTGANSSGKSSVLMSLLGALQTKNFPFYYSPNGSYINMGDFGELAYRHDEKSEVGLTLKFEADENIHLASRFRQDPRTRLPKLSSLNYCSDDLKLTINRRGNVYAASFDYDPTKDPMREVHESPAFQTFADSLDQFLEKGGRARKSKSAKTADRATRQKIAVSRASFKDLFLPKKCRGSYAFRGVPALLEGGGNRFLKHRISEICDHATDFDKLSNYVSSFRLAPERTYYQRTKAALKVDKFGDNWIDQIVEWEQSGAKKFEELTKICRKLGLIDSIKSRRYGGGRYEMKVRPSGSRVDSSLADVGFGVSQFLPLLVADLQLGKGSTFITSQPEIHLHPKIQAEYVNHLVSASISQNKRYILETHSEYLLNRFRLLIAKGRVNADDVAVYYLSRVKDRVRKYRLRFDKDGSIKGAPKDFFETYMMDAMEIALHAEA